MNSLSGLKYARGLLLAALMIVVVPIHLGIYAYPSTDDIGIAFSENFIGCGNTRQITLHSDTLLINACQYDTSDFPQDAAVGVAVYAPIADQDGEWGAATVLYSSDLQNGDEFEKGRVYQDTIAVGAPREDGGFGSPMPNVGAVYIFERNYGGAENWGEIAKLAPTDAVTNDRFGSQIVLSENVLVAAQTRGNSIRYVVFERDLNDRYQWNEVKTITSPTPSIEFGVAFAVTDDTLVVGVQSFSVAGLAQAGMVLVYERNHGGISNWGEAARLYSPDPQYYGRFGRSVDVDAGTIVVGEPHSERVIDDDGAVAFSGVVYLFEKPIGSGSWGLNASLREEMAANNGQVRQFGRVVNISGNRLIVGTPESSVIENSHQTNGSIHVYQRAKTQSEASEWELIYEQASRGEWSTGRIVAIDGDTFAVGQVSGQSVPQSSLQLYNIFTVTERLYLPITYAN